MSILSARIHKGRSAKEGWLVRLGKDGIRMLSDEYIKRRAAVPASIDDIEEARKSISAVIFIVYW